MKNNKTFGIAAIGVFSLLLVVLIAMKASYVEDFLLAYTGVHFLGAIRAIINDAVICLAMVTLLYLSCLNKMPFIGGVVLRVLAFFLFLVYAVDFLVLTNFATHLTVADTLKYASYSLKYVQQIHGGFSGTLILLLLLVSSVFFILSNYKIRNKLAHSIFGTLIAVLFVVSLISYFAEDKYIHSWIYKNVVSHNLVIMSENEQYSEEFAKEFSFEEKFECSSEASDKPPSNIILLMVESLSNYQSDFFSGINNWMPNLDEIARNNVAYTNFYANGFTTEDGEVALLTGKLPIYKPSSFSYGGGKSFSGFYDIKDSLPNILKKQGYATEFLTTADLSFANTGNWAKSIGFEHVEGHENAHYKNMERFHFQAASDEALYNRIVERVKGNGEGKHFYFIKTVSTHHPFINPETKVRSEEAAFKYADKQLGEFHKQLIEMGYFDNGVLVIVGDHHAMVPLKNKEIEKYGSAKASATVPLIVSYGNNVRHLEKNQYQQIDVYGGLQGLVTGNYYHSNWVGDIFTKTPAKYIAHRRGDNRDVITVISEEGVAAVKLDGDNTRVKSVHPIGALSVRDREEIVEKINSTRMARPNTKLNCSH